MCCGLSCGVDAVRFRTGSSLTESGRDGLTRDTTGPDLRQFLRLVFDQFNAAQQTQTMLGDELQRVLNEKEKERSEEDGGGVKEGRVCCGFNCSIT